MVGTGIAIIVILYNAITIRRNSIDLVLFLVLESITCVQLLISGIDGHIFNGSLKMVLIFLFCYVCSRRLPLKRFTSVFSNIIVIIAGISIVLYWFNARILSSGVFPILRTSNITSYANLFVYCVSTAVPHRNCGIFWEPGAFQVYLNLALLFTLNDTELSRRWLRIVILMIALLTTISTTGYICAALILMSYFISLDMKKKFKAILFALAVLLAVGGVVIPIAIESFTYKFGLDGGVISSNVTSRLNPFILDLYIVVDHPLGLPAIDYYAEVLAQYSITHGLAYHASSCTPTMVTAVYGLIPGIFLIFGLVKFVRAFSVPKITLLLVLSLLMMFLTESFLTFSLYYFLAFMGYAGREKKRDLLLR